MKEITKLYLLADARTGVYISAPYTSKVGLLDDLGIAEGEKIVEIDSDRNTDEFSLLWRHAVLRCPVCGAELDFLENVGHELKDGDYLTPPSFVIDYYKYRCRECGEYIKTTKLL